MAITRIGNPAIADQRGINFRNIIINGGMDLAQRSTSVSGITSGLTYHTVDRYQLQLGSLGTWTQSQSTDVPTAQGFSKSLKMDCTTADASPASGDYMVIITKFEGQNLQYLKKGTANAKSLTLSFWVKSNKTGTLQVNARDNDNTRQIGATYTISSANTWEKKTITFVGDTTGAFDNDNNNSLSLEWWLASGSDFNSGSVPTSWEASTNADRNAGSTVNLADNTANEWYITGVQLEAGQVASDFEFLPHDVNLNRCLRYYTDYSDTNYNNYFVPIALFSSTVVRGTIQLPVKMRSAPSITIDGTLTVVGKDAFSGGGGNASSVTLTGTSRSINVGGNTTSSYTNSFMYLYLSSDSIKVDAEL